jgi:REP-associated tyrosine transposase
MPRLRRTGLRAPFFHVVNRSVRKVPIFVRPADYRAFLAVLQEGLTLYTVRVAAYCVLSNHWHLIVAPSGTDQLVRFMRWVTATHAIRWNKHHKTVGTGPVYQGRYHSTAIEFAADLVRACRYVERNALRARLVRRAQDWPWGSLAERTQPTPAIPLMPAPFLLSQAWIDHVNAPLTARERNEEDGIELESTSGTKRVVSVENTPDPLDVPDHPGIRQGRERGVRVIARANQDQPGAHVERAEHLPIRDLSGVLQPAKDRRRHPASAIK